MRPKSAAGASRTPQLRSTPILMHTIAYVGIGLQMKCFLTCCRSRMQAVAGRYRRLLCRILCRAVGVFRIPIFTALHGPCSTDMLLL